MRNKQVLVVLAYWVGLMIHIGAGQLSYSLIAMVSKVLLMPLLAALLLMSRTQIENSIIKWTIFALCFSWLGDIFMIFQDHQPIFFILGLGAFLIAHIGYVIDYRLARNGQSGGKKTSHFGGWVLTILALSVFLTLLFLRIGPGLDDMKVPVILYAGTISVMLLTAFSRYGQSSTPSFWLVFMGAIVFVMSDSLIALNKFWSPILLSDILIMSTYGLAQFLIISGIINHKKG